MLQSAFADVAAVAHIRAIDPRADTDNVVGRGDTGASISAERDVIITSGVKCESPMTNGCVAVAGGVIPSALKPIAMLAAPLLLDSAKLPTPGIISLHSQNFREGAYIFRVHDGNCERLRGFIANDSSKEIPMKRRKTVRVQIPPRARFHISLNPT